MAEAIYRPRSLPRSVPRSVSVSVSAESLRTHPRITTPPSLGGPTGSGTCEKTECICGRNRIDETESLFRETYQRRPLPSAAVGDSARGDPTPTPPLSSAAVAGSRAATLPSEMRRSPSRILRRRGWPRTRGLAREGQRESIHKRPDRIWLTLDWPQRQSAKCKFQQH